MKKYLQIVILLFCAFIAKAQNPIPADSSFPIKQSVGNTPSTLVIGNVFQGKGGMIIGIFTDTTAANRTKIKFYPGAVIYTYNLSASDSGSTWLRNGLATKWLRGSGSIDIKSFTFHNDTTGIICFSNGVCDTFNIVNLFNVVTNIVQNFNDSSVFNINDSTVLICHGTGAARVCDTLHLNNSNTYNIVIHGDSIFAKTCDTMRTVCVGDNCTTSQLCDSILLSGPPPVTQYQNGVYKNPATNVVEFGDVGGNQAALFHNTILNAYGSNLLVAGQAPGYEPLSIQQRQISNLSSSIFSFNHLGGNIYTYPWRIDNNNQVNLYINYTDRFFTGVSAPFTGDSIGYMYDKIGYMIMGNSRGGSTKYDLDNAISKQNGLMIHTLDTGNTDAITIFGNQIPKQYAFSVSPFPTTTLLDSRIAVFHTDLSSNFLGKVYLTNGRLEPDTALIVAANNLTLGLGNVNLVSGATTINAITTSGWQAGSSVIVLKFSGAPLVKNNTAGGAGTATILLAGRTDFQAAAGDVLSLMYDGTNFYELNRTLASGAGITGITADNGLTTNTATNVRLGGTLVTATTITGSTNLMTFTGSNTGSNYTMLIANSSTGRGLSVTSSSGTGINANASSSGTGVNAVSNTGLAVSGTSTSNTAVFGTTASTNSIEDFAAIYGLSTGNTPGIYGKGNTGIGVAGYSVSSYAGYFSIQNSVNNTVVPVVRINRYQTGGTAANGIGGSLDFYNETDASVVTFSNSIISKWTTVASATRTSQLDITGVNSAATGTIASFYGSGVVGIGISSSYTATRLNVVDNTIAATPMIDISSTSTLAASNSQKVINVGLSGANATNSQTTYGIYSANNHSGTSNVNYAIYGTTSNEFSGAAVAGVGVSGYGVQGQSTNNHGVVGSSTGANGGNFTSSSSTGVVGNSTTGLGAEFQVNPSSTNSVVTVMKVRALTSGTATTGLGASIVYEGEVSNGTVGNLGSINYSYTAATATAETSTITFKNYLAGSAVNALVLAGDGSMTMRPITATAASAITPAEGMIVMVSSTNGTFTSIGFWGYQNGAWHAF